MSQSKAPAIEVQKKTEPARQPEQGPVQQVAPQAAYRRAQVELRPADLLALQRVVGNRMVQRMVAQCLDRVEAQPGQTVTITPTLDVRLQAIQGQRQVLAVKNRPTDYGQTYAHADSFIVQLNNTSTPRIQRKEFDTKGRVKADEKLERIEAQIAENVTSIHDENEIAASGRRHLKALADLQRPLPDKLRGQMDRINRLKSLEDKIEAIDKAQKTSKGITIEVRNFLQWRKRSWVLQHEIEEAEATSRHLAQSLDNLKAAKIVAIEEIREASKSLLTLMRSNGPNYRAKGRVNFDEVMPREVWDAIPPPKPALATDHLVALDRISKLPELNDLLALYVEASSPLKAKIKCALKDLGDIPENLVRINRAANLVKSNKSWNEITHDQVKFYRYSVDDVKKMGFLENQVLACIQQKILALTSQYKTKIKGR